MNMRTLTAPCGLDCFNCHLYETNIIENDRKVYSQRLNVPLEEVACKGCKPEKGRCRFTQNCATWACTQKKDVDFCYECSEFPCGLLMPTAKGSQFQHNFKLYNLCRMKLIGLDAWFKEACNIRKLYYEGEFIVGQGPVFCDNNNSDNNEYNSYFE